jgi:hypothetical protein
LHGCRAARYLIGKKAAVNTLGAHLEFALPEYLARDGLSAEHAKQVTRRLRACCGTRPWNGRTRAVRGAPVENKGEYTCLLLCRSDQLSAAGAEHPFDRIAWIANKCFVSCKGRSRTGRLIVDIDLLRIPFMYD